MINWKLALTLLGVMFVGLKLTNFITWSWWLVLLPFYFTFALWLAIMCGAGLFIGFVGVLIAIINKVRENRNPEAQAARRHRDVMKAAERILSRRK